MERDRLKETLGKFWKLGRTRDKQDFTPLPESTFDAVLELRLRELQRQVGEVRNRINGLFFFVLGAALVQVALNFVG